MPKTAILFTGQGAQSVGMGKDVAEACPAAADIFERANLVVGYDLRSVCFQGPPEKLEQTDIQQPAIFTTSVAIWRAVNERVDVEEPPAAMAGLSLGEYTALYAAGSVSFEDGLTLVKRRGELMQAAADAIPGGMVTALGLDVEKIQEVVREASAEGVFVAANYNCPGQVVLSGSKKACESAVPLIERAGGRAVPLKVAGGFHSPLMQPAADGLAEVLAQTRFGTPSVPVIANVHARPHGQPDDIRQCLADQLTHTVCWQASMEALIAEGVERFIEIGPGRILTGLLKKIARGVPIVNVSTADSLRALSASMG